MPCLTSGPRVFPDCGAAMLPMSRTAILSLVLGLTLLVAACASAPYTGRRQLLFSSEGSETRMGYQAFEQIKRQYKLSQDPEANALVTRVGRRIADAAQRPDYRWEFLVFEGKEANAFCLPGGKVGVFTGILKYTQDEAGMATVISHEVAHALARHAGERMSQSMLAQAGGLGLGVALGGAGSARRLGHHAGLQPGHPTGHSPALQPEPGVRGGPHRPHPHGQGGVRPGPGPGVLAAHDDQ